MFELVLKPGPRSLELYERTHAAQGMVTLEMALELGAHFLLGLEVEAPSIDPAAEARMVSQVISAFSAQAALTHEHIGGRLQAVNEHLTSWMQAVHQGTSGVDSRLSEMTEALRSSRERAEADKLSTAKGRVFEEAVLDSLDRFASVRGDTAFDVSTMPGVGGSKVGDLLLGAAGSVIAIECKATRLSSPDLIRTLDEAKRSREAQAAVVVFSRQEECPSALPIRCFGGGRVAVVYDRETDGPTADSLLQAAFELARAAAVAEQAAGATVDCTSLNLALGVVGEALDELRGLKRGISATRKGVDAIEASASALESRIREALSEVAAPTP